MYRPAFHSSHPEATEEDEESTSSEEGSSEEEDSEESSEEEGSSSEEEPNVAVRRYDRLMQARDEWTSASQAWIPGAGRVPPAQSIVALRASSGGSVGTPRPDATAIPQELRANDIRRHVINVDSQFREDPTGSTSSNFYFRLLNTVKNVLRIRVTSIEFPNNYKFFTALRRNVSILVTLGGVSRIITIANGNYTAGDMEAALQEGLDAAFTPAGTISVTWDEITGLFTFTSTSATFSIGLGTGTYYDRPFAYGLGYYLGFSYNGGSEHTATLSGGTYTLTSDTCANFAGDPYVFLKVNDFDCVVQNVGENDFHALAKIVLREPKNYMAFDDYASQHIKEVVFQSPRDLSRFHVRILDPYGEPVDMCSAQISFSLEVLEIQNHTLYDTVRDSIMLRYV
jgi:hypothetical protein